MAEHLLSKEAIAEYQYRGYSDAMESIKYNGLATTRQHYANDKAAGKYNDIYWAAFSKCIKDEENEEKWNFSG